MNSNRPILPSFWTFWERQPHNGDYLRQWLTRIPGILTPNLPDRAVEIMLRDWMYNHIPWGQQDAGTAGMVDSPVNLLQYIDAHPAVNGGIGPLMNCAPYSCIYVGLLAVFGIPARQVVMCRVTDGAVDNPAEFWDRQEKQWVMVSPFTNLHWELDGVRLSALEWAKDDRTYQAATPVPLSGSGEVKWNGPCGVNLYRSMSGRTAVHRGNWPFAGGADALSPDKWQRMEVLPPLGNVITQTNIVAYGTFDPTSVTNAPDQA